MDNYLKTILNDCDSLPFLFVGSGMSKRYLNLPNWQELLKALSEETYGNTIKFSQNMNTIRSKYGINLEDNYNEFMCRMCDMIEQELNIRWFEDIKFEQSRSDYLELIDQGVSPLKIEIMKYLRNKSQINTALSEEIESLKSISLKSISGIITTNYDTFLEETFSFVPYSSQDDLMFTTNYGVGEIYKIHGSLDSPDTIMINSDDYKRIEQKNKYLAAKLLTIFAEHPIIFLGYSIGDEDIQNILSSIVDCLDSKKLDLLQKRLIFIDWDPSESDFKASTSSLSFGAGKGTLTMQKITLNDYSILYRALAKRKSKYPINTLRTLKHDMHKLVLTNDPDNKLYVTSPDKLVENSSNIEFYAGFGIIDVAKRGYRSIQPYELFQDILFDDQDFDPELMLESALPPLKKFYSPLPEFKYWKLSSFEELPGYLQDTTFDTFLNKSIRKAKIREKSIEEILSNDNYSTKDRIVNIPKLNIEDINLEALEEFLQNVWMEDPTLIAKPKNSFHKTELKRLIRILDWMKYK
ncbi:hypothetical protein HB884_05235 [Listeria booriae]|uniref:SIR2 family protein n=1 Tax=Listeria booriae TaxID=1552123 RepID=UPI001629295A|nr:SIR2 family protein [Listeria booriae]MBC1523608.1 hypothetical protein [Listeria booriae]